MENTYWDKSGKYQAEYDRLIELMPPSGNAATVAGELMRAISRLGYDLYNNGMVNNTSGAVNMLLEKGAIEHDVWAVIYPFTRGRLYEGNYNGDMLQVAIETAVDRTIEHILVNPGLETQANSEDMFEWQEPDEHYCEDCGEVADGMWGSFCNDCEEQHEEEQRLEEEEEELRRQEEEEAE